MKLITKRLILRKPKEEDLKQIYNLIDKEIIKNFFMPYPCKLSHIKKFLSTWIKDWKAKSYWGILELRDTREVIGVCGLRELDKIYLTAEQFYWVGSKFRQKGYISEIQFEINNYFFDKLKMRKLKSEVATFNKPSNKMQKKFGMKLEGMKRKEYYNPFLKKFVDMNSYSIFKDEWKKKSRNLKVPNK